MLTLILLALVAVPRAHIAPGVGQPPGFTPAQLDDAGLSANAFRVLHRIYRRWTPARGCYETKPNMAAGCRIGRDAVYSALDELESRRFIVRTGRGAGARIDWLPSSEWLDEPAEFVRDQGTNRNSGSGVVTPGETPDPGEEITPDLGDERSSGSGGLKGYPPKGIHEGDSSSTTTSPGDEEGAADAGGVVVDEGGGPEREVDPDRDAKNRAWQLLRDRDVAQAVELAAAHWRHVPEAVAAYDAGLADGSIGGPGWFAGALPKWVPNRKTPARQAATHTGPLPGGVNGLTLLRQAEADRDKVASPDTVAAAMTEAEAALAEGARQRAEAAERLRQERRAARRAAAPAEPQPQDS